MKHWFFLLAILAGLSVAQAQPEFSYDGRLVFEATAAPESLPFPDLTSIEILFHLAKPWLAVRFHEGDRQTTYVLDGLTQQRYVLLEVGDKKQAWLVAATGEEWAAWFAKPARGSHPFETTGRARALAEKPCREYYYEGEDTWTNVWMEPNFTIKGQPFVEPIFWAFHPAFADGAVPLPPGFVFSISYGLMEEEGTAARLDIVQREIALTRLSLGDYDYMGEEPDPSIPEY